MGIFSTWHLLIVAGIAVLLFGNRLPKVARSLGQSITEFRRGVSAIGEPLDETEKKLRHSIDEVNQELRKK